MTLLDRIAARLRRTSPHLLLAFLLLLQTVIHVPWLNLPPSGFHTWRQTQLLSVSRNYVEESMNFFQPRVDSRGAGTGIVGKEFPFVDYAIAIVWRVTGAEHGAHRMVLLALSFLGVIGMFLLARELMGSHLAGFTAGLFIIFSPLYAYYSITALPDVTMLGFLCVGLHGLARASSTLKVSHLCLGVASLTLAALVKLSAGAAGFAGIVLLVSGWKRSNTAWRAAVIVTCVAAAIIVLSWYGYSRWLTETHGQFEFLQGLKLPQSLDDVTRPLWKVGLQWLPELFVSYPQFVLVLVGAWALARRRDDVARHLRSWVLAYAAGLAVFAAAFLSILDVHDYFMHPAVPLLVLIATIGVRSLYRASRQRRAVAELLLVLLLAVPIVGGYRGLSRFTRDRPHPDVLLLESSLDTLVPRDAHVVVADDFSPSIYLYFAHRKGRAVRASAARDTLATLTAAGARWLISDSRTFEARSDVARRIRLAGQAGKFNIYSMLPDSVGLPHPER